MIHTVLRRAIQSKHDLMRQSKHFLMERSMLSRNNQGKVIWFKITISINSTFYLIPLCSYLLSSSYPIIIKIVKNTRASRLDFMQFRVNRKGRLVTQKDNQTCFNKKDVIFEGKNPNYRYNVIRLHNIPFNFTAADFTLMNLNDLITLVIMIKFKTRKQTSFDMGISWILLIATLLTRVWLTSSWQQPSRRSQRIHSW